MNAQSIQTQFKADVDAGLRAKQKYLSSMYFYDKKGDELFMKIMQMPEYYLTRAELDIFTKQTQELIKSLQVDQSARFELIELGAGDGSKTKHLLKELLQQGYQFDYMPIDISGHVLELLETTLKAEMPDLSIKTQQGDYFQSDGFQSDGFQKLDELKDSHHPKVILFLGSNIGNMHDDKASQFIYDLGKSLSLGDKLLIGVDLIKAESIVLPAYNDPQGITGEFNINLLRRINNELGANFDLNEFVHAPEYSQEEGIASSFLKSKSAQSVTIDSIGRTYHFEAGEKIHMEISRKYNTQIMQKIIKETDFQLIGCLMDSQQYFADYILERC